jgi:uncharacterized protein (UPF0332 family)
VKQERARAEVVRYWMDKAHEALKAARSEQEAGRFVFSVNRAYYACFYSASEVLVTHGERFSKHSGVRGALHRSLVKTGKLDSSWGRFYDLVFNARQRGDYQELVEFSSEETEELILQAEQFVSAMNMLLENRG